MEAKEKAEKLVLMFLRIENNTPEWFNTHIAKQCAIIAVDEIMKILWHTHNNESEYRYWEQVKTEINNL
jgi:hypothetical protein